MNAHELPNALYTLCRRGGMALFCLLAAVVTSLSATGWADSLYLITGDGDTAIILDPEQETAPDLSSQMIYVTNGGRGYDITLREGTSVTVRHEDSVQSLPSRQERISTLLGRLGISPSPLEMIGVKLSETGVELTVSDHITYYDYATEKVSFSTQRVANPEMPEGEEKVVQEGADGVRSSVYEVVWSNGAELSRQFVEELASTAVDQVIEYGTAKPASEPSTPSTLPTGGAASAPAELASAEASAEASLKARTSLDYGETGGGIAGVVENADGSGTLTLKDGTVLNYSGVRSMSATAYTSGHGGVGTRTASGTAVHVGTVAVDKSVIPLGTRMYIVAGDSIVYGLAVAEDTGVKGSKIDLYYDTYEQCIQFGRRACTVYILE